MTVLCTGAPGWAGTRFVEILREKDRDVTCLVLPGLDTDYLESLGAKIVRGDITKSMSYQIPQPIETIFHIAGIIHPRMFHVNDLFKVNTKGTENIFIEAMISDAKFIYISSNSAAGTNKELMNEFTQRKPYMKYGKSKFLAEEYINQFKDTVILRPCWYYGPRQPARQTKLIKMVKDGKAPIFGDGENLRSMTYIDNLCQAMLLAEKSKIANGETYWIADERPYTMLEIYETIAELLNVKLKLRRLPNILCTFGEKLDKLLQSAGIYSKTVHVLGEMNKNIACSIAKAKKDLKYKPKIELKEGMKRSIEWMRCQGLI